MDNIEREVRDAIRLGYGIHYGQYKADHPHTKELGKLAVEEEPDTEPVIQEEPDVVCPICGKNYERTHKLQKYCCDMCRQIAIRNQANERYNRKMGSMPILTCPICKTEFQPVHRGQKYCGKGCYRQAELKRRKEKRCPAKGDEHNKEEKS